MVKKSDLKVEGLNKEDRRTEGNLVQMDPPMHAQLRKIVSHAFTRKVVADLEPRIAPITHEFLDAVDQDGHLERVPLNDWSPTSHIPCR